MKKYIVHIKFIFLILLVVFLFGFAAKRNSLKKTKEIDVTFSNGNNLFITYEAVNKLLIQKLDTAKTQALESLFLNNLEEYIKSNEMIRNAEVYHTLDGKLGALITQRTPVLRVVEGGKSYYLDESGEKMPLSEYYSARIPVYAGSIDEKNKDIVELANRIKQDDFLKKQITGIEQMGDRRSNQFVLRTRVGHQIVVFGDIHSFNDKKTKLKAFYQKALADGILKDFDTINLMYKNQVVCTKK